MPRMLVVDDEPSICWGLSRLGENLGCAVDTASSAEQALRLSDRPGGFDVVILDVRLPGIDGLSAMEELQLRLGATPIVVVTAFGDLSTAVRAVEAGAFEYVVKPFDLAEIRAVIERALGRRRLPLAAQSDAADGREPPAALEGMIGRSPEMQGVFKRIALAAQSDAAVLITGESGVGKKLAARAIHHHSACRDAPLVFANVAALEGDALERELFGVPALRLEAGKSFGGRIDAARTGTLVLEETAQLPLPLQAKFLETLEEAAASFGAPAAKPGFRLIATSDADLSRRVRAGLFRQDLLLSIRTFEIAIPPLRERVEDIPLLAERFAQYAGRTASRARLSSETLDELKRRPWYGNVRELRSAIEHARILARSGVVSPEHLPPAAELLVRSVDGLQRNAPFKESVDELANHLLADPAAAGVVYDRFLSEVEPPLLAAALARSGRQCAPAARALGLHRTTLKRKLAQYGMDAEGEGDA